MHMMEKKKPFWGVVGLIFVLVGMTYTLATAIQPNKSITALLISGTCMVIGVLIIAWAFSE